MEARADRGATRVAGPAQPTAPQQPVLDLTDSRAGSRPTVHEEVVRSPVTVEAPDRRDRVRWGPVWAGTITVLATFLLLELAFIALGWLTLDPGAPDPSGPGTPTSVYLMTGLAGVLAFLLGGLTAAASAMWRGAGTGLLHGILVWALSTTSILLLTLLGGGALFGAFSDVLGQISALQNALGQGGVDIGGAAYETAQDAARWALLALGAFVAASALGGLLGAKVWPPKDHDREDAGAER